jgi:hypothetical protein
MAVVDGDGARILSDEELTLVGDSVNLWREEERAVLGAIASSEQPQTVGDTGSDEPEGLDEPAPESG